MAIPLMLITLGVAIARLQPSALGRALWLCLRQARASASRSPLAVGLVFGLPRLALAVLVLQVATPGRGHLLHAGDEVRGRADEVAGLVVVSTLLSVITIPLTLAFFL